MISTIVIPQKLFRFSWVLHCLIEVIPVPGFGVMLEPIWSPDGKGFFVESKTSSSYDLLYVDREGHAKLLRKSPIPIWGVPSRDGRKLAFPGETISSNVWIGHTSLR